LGFCPYKQGKGELKPEFATIVVDKLAVITNISCLVFRNVFIFIVQELPPVDKQLVHLLLFLFSQNTSSFQPRASPIVLLLFVRGSVTWNEN